jgi:FtsZ-interacting cell division protein ZipA
MIGFIKKLFSGILSFLFGLIGGKKSEPQLAASNAKGKKSKGYFMELDEDEQEPININKAAQAVADQAKAVADKTKDKTKELVASAKSALPETPKATEATAKNQPAKTEAKAKNQPAKTEATAKNQPAKTEATANNQAAKVELVQTAEGVKAEPAKSKKASAASANTPTETTFAPKYLAPSASTNGRRRPGPNMNTFLDMARQVKTPS